MGISNPEFQQTFRYQIGVTIAKVIQETGRKRVKEEEKEVREREKEITTLSAMLDNSLCGYFHRLQWVDCDREGQRGRRIYTYRLSKK